MDADKLRAARQLQGINAKIEAIHKVLEALVPSLELDEPDARGLLHSAYDEMQEVFYGS